VGREFAKIRFFRDWDLGRNGPLRKPQPADLPSDFLLEDASNLGLVLNDLETHHPDVKRAMLERLKLLYDRVQDLGGGAGKDSKDGKIAIRQGFSRFFGDARVRRNALLARSDIEPCPKLM
jgi:predicted ATPase